MNKRLTKLYLDFKLMKNNNNKKKLMAKPRAYGESGSCDSTNWNKLSAEQKTTNTLNTAVVVGAAVCESVHAHNYKRTIRT